MDKSEAILILKVAVCFVSFQAQFSMRPLIVRSPAPPVERKADGWSLRWVPTFIQRLFSGTGRVSDSKQNVAAGCRWSKWSVLLYVSFSEVCACQYCLAVSLTKSSARSLCPYERDIVDRVLILICDRICGLDCGRD